MLESYLEDELNDRLLQLNDVTNKLQSAQEETEGLKNRLSNLSIAEAEPSFVFHVDSFGKNVDEHASQLLSDRISELEVQSQQLLSKQADLSREIHLLREFLEELDSFRHSSAEDWKSTLKFVLQLIDTDPYRAKLEIMNLLKEEE